MKNGKGEIKSYKGLNKFFFLTNTLNHQTIFHNRKAFDKVGLYDINYKITADYEWQLRAYFKYNLTFHYSKVLISVYSVGGMSDSMEPKLLNLRLIERYDLLKKYFGKKEALEFYENIKSKLDAKHNIEDFMNKAEEDKKSDKQIINNNIKTNKLKIKEKNEIKPFKPPYRLAVIIPSNKGENSFPTVKSAYKQKGFDIIDVILVGNSCDSDKFRKLSKKEFPKLFLGKKNNKNIKPGEARNEGLNIIEKELNSNVDFILFIDDDIIIPENYSIELYKFLKRNRQVSAVMGRVETYPQNYWTKIIDYSNFWWLQLKKDVTNLGWLGTGATLIDYDDSDILQRLKPLGSLKEPCFSWIVVSTILAYQR